MTPTLDFKDLKNIFASSETTYFSNINKIIKIYIINIYTYLYYYHKRSDLKLLVQDAFVHYLKKNLFFYYILNFCYFKILLN